MSIDSSPEKSLNQSSSLFFRPHKTLKRGAAALTKQDERASQNTLFNFDVKMERKNQLNTTQVQEEEVIEILDPYAFTMIKSDK